MRYGTRALIIIIQASSVWLKINVAWLNFIKNILEGWYSSNK